ncbi:DUF1552 domain-containing protein [Pirellulaceae bacterium]|nr:DUF1552 domain-containing protein [Pirellulaceae bacterium]
MNKPWHLSRRSALRGIGASLALPLLECMSDANGQLGKQTPQARMAFLYFPNGVAEGSWEPEQTGANGTLEKLSPWMTPLEKHKEHLLIPRNIWTPRGNGHMAGTATWLTGGEYSGREVSAGGMSVDQLAAKQVGRDTLLDSLQLSVRGEGFFSKSLPRNTISWLDRQTPASREIEPRIVFDQMFRTSDQFAPDSSVLDLILEDAKSLQQQLGAVDRDKLDQYLTSIQAIERRLKFSDKQAARAQDNALLNQRLKRPEAGIPEDHGEYMKLMLDMIVLGFWADATRVSTFMFDHGQSNRYFNFIDGVQGTWHALSHYHDISGKTEDDDGLTSWSSVKEKRGMYNAVTRWHHEQVAYLLDQMREIKEGDATLLDNSMIVYGSSLGDGHEHSADNLPVLFAGGSNLNIKTGRYLEYSDNTDLNRYYLSMLHRMGIEVNRFGTADDELPGLT